MTLSQLPLESLLFLVFDLALLVVAGVFALRLPATPDADRTTFPQPQALVGLVAFARGAWRLIYLPGLLGSAFEFAGELGAQNWLRVATGVLVVLLFLALGFLLAHRAIAEALGQGGARNTVLGIGRALHAMRGLLALLAFVAAVFTILPYLPSGGPVRRRRRLF